MERNRAQLSVGLGLLLGATTAAGLMLAPSGAEHEKQNIELTAEDIYNQKILRCAESLGPLAMYAEELPENCDAVSATIRFDNDRNRYFLPTRQNYLARNVIYVSARQ
jgi:hypothetical protein